MLHGFLQQIELNEQKFAEERDFFLKQGIKDQEVQAQLQGKIASLERKLAHEKSYALNIFVKGEVQKSCARALLKYEYAASEGHASAARDQAAVSELTVRKQESQASSSQGEVGSTSAGKYKEMYQDVVQQLQCEKKLNENMLDILENKVSELIAENGTLKVKNI